MRLRHLVLPLLAPLTALLLDCATLDKLPADTCGNGVVDALEDCDSFPSASDPKARCGAPSAGASKCRLLCGKQADGVVLDCPDGWGCSVSGFCRQPTGTFASAGEAFSAGVTTMLVGDFDGDGRKDVLGSSGVTSKGRIHYFKDKGAPQVVELPGVLASPLVFDFDGDGRSDVAFGYSSRGATEVAAGILELSSSNGFAIILGQQDRAVVSRLFPVLTVPSFDAFIIPVLAKPSELPPTTIAGPVVSISMATIKLKDGTQPTLLRSLDGDPSDPTQGFLKAVPGTLADLAGVPIFARIFDGLGAKSTCGEVVVPLATSTAARVLVYSPCEKTAAKVSWSRADPQEIAIPGETLTSIFAVDVDQDGHIDIIIGTTRADGKPKVRVAYGTGTTLELTDAPSDLTEVPLAAGFIDADQKIDFVTPAGVLLTSKAAVPTGLPTDAGADASADGAPAPTPRNQLSWNNVPAPTKRWTVAEIADVNRDGNPDVIGASAFEPDIDVLEGTRTLAMPPFTIPTTGSVTNLAAGDFDFDLTLDIAFVQARPASTVREVAISYGRALTMPPELPRPAGRLDGIRQVFVTPGGLTLTSTTKAPVATDLPSFSLAVLLSSGERQPVAPLLFKTPIGAPGGNRVELATRALVASQVAAPVVDLIALVSTNEYTRANGARAKDPAYAVWIAPGTGALSFLAPTSTIDLQGLTAVDRATGQFVVQLVAGDLDGTKKASLVSIAPDTGSIFAAMRIIHPGPGTVLPVPVPIPGRSAPGGMRAQLLDVDGDGNNDLVTVLRDTASKVLAVNLFFGDGKGALALPGTVINLPVPAGESADDYATLGFTQITSAAGAFGAISGKRRELAIVTPKHVFRAFVRGDRKVDVQPTSMFGNIVYGSAVAAGDFDGDGVEDLALADQGSIRIALQNARLP